eukprot:GHVL01019754.1.p1 GENE.GHVL01019754.1~~GHVL01019754.1.p1  ORF type:complete len:125 (+),score=22.75 GHVL01019754.1:30-404(+)
MSSPPLIDDPKIKKGIGYKFQTTMSRICRTMFRGPGYIYSLNFGIIAGLTFCGIFYTFIPFVTAIRRVDLISIESRRRYEEKQKIFQKKIEFEKETEYLKNLAAEYNPVATRQPFKELEDKYLF